MKKFLLLLLISLPLLAANLQLKEGFVAAHTEMMMDSTIDPLNNHLHADLTMQADDVTSLRGKLWVEMSLFSSDNVDRDQHMHETNEVEKYPLATYTISNVTKTDNGTYTIDGELNFYGQNRPFALQAEILLQEETISINATSKIRVSDFGMEMPCIMFMCVRDQVDIFAKAVLIKR